MNVATFITAFVTALGSSRALVAFSINGDMVSVTTAQNIGDATLTDQVQKQAPEPGDETTFGAAWGKEIVDG